MRMKKKIFAAALAIAMSLSFAVISLAAGEDGVILGGCAFGVRLADGRLTVDALEDVEGENGRICPAGDAGVAAGDEIVSINGETVGSAADLARIIERSEGAVTLTVRRGGKCFDIAVAPQISVTDGRARLGIWVKDSTAGIGTMTFVVPGTLAFGALGHGIGIKDGEEESGSETRGGLYNVAIEGVRRGQSGSPGELRGTFGEDKIGAVIVNCEDGIFGVCSSLPAGLDETAVVTLCPASEVKQGAAKLYCTLGEDGVRAYDVQISDIGDGGGERSFVVTVTDPALIERTGGIVQGMSGSPLVQDGRLVGAVTHVMVSDPTRGFGTFIGNMLEELPAVLR